MTLYGSYLERIVEDRLVRMQKTQQRLLTGVETRPVQFIDQQLARGAQLPMMTRIQLAQASLFFCYSIEKRDDIF